MSTNEPYALNPHDLIERHFMLLTFVVFVGYESSAAAVRNHMISRPRVLIWMRRVFAGALVALGVRLAFTDR